MSQWTHIFAELASEAPTLKSCLVFFSLFSIGLVLTREMFRREVPRLVWGANAIAGMAGLTWLICLVNDDIFTPTAIADLGVGYVFLLAAFGLVPGLVLVLCEPILKRHSRMLDKLFANHRKQTP